jgi:hypothetical protein
MKVHKLGRISLIVALVANLSGCATYIPARLPADMAHHGDNSPRFVPVVVGLPAKATLDSGDVVAGEVTAVTDSSLTIGRAGNYGFQERVVFATELVRLEVEDRSSFASASVGAVAAVVVVLTLGIVIIAATQDPVSEF